MADGPITGFADIIEPSVFLPYVQKITEEKSRLISSGAVVNDPMINSYLSEQGGTTFDVPVWNDLDNDEENVSSTSADDEYTGGSANSSPKKITSYQQTGVRLNRNQSWSTSDLAGQLAGSDPAEAIARRVGEYWVRREQQIFLSLVKGIFADNAAAPSGSEHVQNDLTVDVSGASFADGVTNFSTEAFIDSTLTMGDSMEQLGMVMVHSVVYSRMIKNNLIDFIPDARGEANTPTFLGRQVVIDDGMPIVSAGVYESWLFGSGAVHRGEGSPKVPVETTRKADAGNGGGQENMYHRKLLCFHPDGYRWVGNAGEGGPSNAATSNNLSNAASWQRVAPERKQVKIARLITRED